MKVAKSETGASRTVAAPFRRRSTGGTPLLRCLAGIA